MICPKCAGLLIHEDAQEHSGRFHGWRCVQCGLRLDETIAQNRLEARPMEVSADLDEPDQDELFVDLPERSTRRLRRPARSAQAKSIS